MDWLKAFFKTERKCECEFKLGLYKVNSSYHDNKCRYSKNWPNDNKIQTEDKGLSRHIDEQNKDSEIEKSNFDSDEKLEFKNINSNCTCELNLGVFKSSEIEGSCYKTKHVHEEFFRNDELKSKIDEMKSKSSQGIFDENIIAIPNHILLPEKVESFLGICEHQNFKNIQSYAQDVLHQSIINAVRYLNMKAFVVKQFQSHLIFGLISKNAVKENKEYGDQLNLTNHDVELVKVLSSENIDELLNEEQYINKRKFSTNFEWVCNFNFLPMNFKFQLIVDVYALLYIFFL